MIIATIRQLAYAWVACVLLLFALVAAIMVASESGPFGVIACFVLLALTLSLCIVCARLQIELIRQFCDHNVGAGYWWALLALSTLIVIPGVVMEVAAFLVWCQFGAPAEVHAATTKHKNPASNAAPAIGKPAAVQTPKECKSAA
jgi:hypothetical protein